MAQERNKRILFVDDEPRILQGLARMLRSMRSTWSMVFAESGRDALKIMEELSVDVLVCDLHMPGMDGGQVLATAAARHPGTVRLILSGHGDRKKALDALKLAHQFLPKPCDAKELKSTIESAIALSGIIEDKNLRDILANIQTLPSLPTLYQKLVTTIQSPDSSSAKVAAVISRDAAMTAKILQLVNSAFFGVGAKVSDAGQAVNLLGFETVKALVLTFNIFEQFDKTLLTRFSLEWFWEHSFMTALVARRLAMFQKADKKSVEACFTAGLLHDIGKLVLAANLPEQYDMVVELVHTRHHPFHKAEREIFKATHEEVGAYLLGIWGLPGEIVEAAGRHHHPGCGNGSNGFTPVTAVHVADIIDHQRNADKRVAGDFQFNEQCLTAKGFKELMPSWYKVAENVFEQVGNMSTFLPAPPPALPKEGETPKNGEPPMRNGDPGIEQTFGDEARMRVLFVDDEKNVLQGLKRLLRDARRQWAFAMAESADQALEIMSKHHFDVVVSDMRMPGMNGAELLEIVQRDHPQTVRVILSGHSDRDDVIKAAGHAHQFLPKPCDKQTLRAVMARAASLRPLLANGGLRRTVSRMDSLPVLPSQYARLLNQLQSEDVSLKSVGEIISADVGMTAKVLQLVNSAFFGLPQHVNSPAQAVNLLGLETIKALVLSVHIFSQASEDTLVRTGLDRLADHSLATGVMAREVARFEKAEKQVVDNAFLAGIVHDSGKILLASHLGDEYEEAARRAREENIPIWRAELSVFGVTHAEVGAYLLGIWGLPEAIVTAVHGHHRPDLSDVVGFHPLAAVHVADIIEHGMSGMNLEAMPFSREFIDSNQFEDKILDWVDICASVKEREDADEG